MRYGFESKTQLADGPTPLRAYIGIVPTNGSQYGDGLVGNTEVNTLWGMSGPDYLYGRAGDDVLDGGHEDDLLSGGSGADTLAGGEGRDWADYENSPAGVLVSLIDHVAAGGDAQGDVLSGIEGLTVRRFPTFCWATTEATASPVTTVLTPSRASVAMTYCTAATTMTC